MKPALTLRLKQETKLDSVLLLIKKNRTFFPYTIAIEDSEKVNLGSRFNQIKPGKQKDVINNVVEYYQRVCLNHPGDRGHLEIYNERLQCLRAFDLQETLIHDDEGVITLVEESSIKGRHKELLKKNYKTLEEQVDKEKINLE